MGISKAKKAIKALQERVNTCYENSDLLKRALSKEDYEATMKCAEEIKDVLEAYEKQVNLARGTITNAKRKLQNQKAELKKLKQRKDPIEELTDCLQRLEKTEKYDIKCSTTVFYDKKIRLSGIPININRVGSKTIVTLKEGRQFGIETDGIYTKVVGDED